MQLPFFLPRIRKPALPPLLAVYGHHFQSEVFGKRLECYLWHVATWKYKNNCLTDA